MDELSNTQGSGNRWLLLIHQLPAKPAYLRVKVWRRLQALGAVAVKNAVYALPANEQAQEDFEWLLREIGEGGGEAFVCEARLIDGLSDHEVRALFDHARDADYEAIAKEARTIAEALGAEAAFTRAADRGAHPTHALEGTARPGGRDRFLRRQWPRGGGRTVGRPRCQARGGSRSLPERGSACIEHRNSRRAASG